MLPKELKNQKFATSHWRHRVWEVVSPAGQDPSAPCWAPMLYTPQPLHTNTHTKKKLQWVQGHVCNPHMCLRSGLHVPSYPAHAGCWHCKECLTCCGKTSFSSCFNIRSLMPWEKVCMKYHLLWESTKTSMLWIFLLGGGGSWSKKKLNVLKKIIYDVFLQNFIFSVGFCGQVFWLGSFLSGGGWGVI